MVEVCRQFKARLLYFFAKISNNKRVRLIDQILPNFKGFWGWRIAQLPLILLCLLTTSSFVLAAPADGDAEWSGIVEILETQGLPEAVRTLYADKGYRPLWLKRGRPSRQARQVIQHIRDAASHGLNADDFALPVELRGKRPVVPPEQVMRTDAALTKVLLGYASSLADGHYRSRRMDPKWHIRKKEFDAAAWLSAVLKDGRLGSSLDRLTPVHPVYSNLKRALEEYRKIDASGGWPGFPAKGPRKFEPGARHRQIVPLRQRLAVTDGAMTETSDPEFYDPELVEAVKRFQRRHGLNDDGVVGWRTRAAMSVPVDRRIVELRAALERWRWMPQELGSSYVLANVPAYRLWFYENAEPTLTMRTIVGKYKRQTPTFSASISYFVLRPKWYVPNSIAVKDLVPKAQEDPEYFLRGGYVIREKETGQTVDPRVVDWSVHGEHKPFPYRLVQGAGGRNALGDIKFMFENPYGVYLHDTSSPRLFAKDTRAFSSGCVRVEKPLELASRILSEGSPTSPESVKGMISRSHKNKHLGLTKKVPLYVIYVTAWADKENVYFYDDVYRRDARLLGALAD